MSIQRDTKSPFECPACYGTGLFLCSTEAYIWERDESPQDWVDRANISAIECKVCKGSGRFIKGKTVFQGLRMVDGVRLVFIDRFHYIGYVQNGRGVYNGNYTIEIKRDYHAIPYIFWYGKKTKSDVAFRVNNISDGSNDIISRLGVDR